jgi:predicted transcriptional regulator
MKVKLFEKKKIFTMHTDTTVMDLIELFYDYTVPYINIFSEDNKIIGAAAYSDMFKLLFPDYDDIRKHGEYLFDPRSILVRDEIFINNKIKHLLHNNSQNIDVDMPMKKVLEIINAHGLNHLPVVENEKLIGVLTLSYLTDSYFCKKSNRLFAQTNG